MKQYLFGVDLGQAADYTAICVIEKVDETLNVRHLERLKLGTPFPDQVQHIKRIYEAIRNMIPPDQIRKAGLGGGEILPIHLIVDYTGVGRAVVDLMRQEGLSPIALAITGGNDPRKEGKNWFTPKRDLVYELILAFQTGRLKIAKSLPEADTLTRELQNFKMKVNIKTGHDSYEAWREGVHDDLVLSVAMAVYAAKEDRPSAPILVSLR